MCVYYIYIYTVHQLDEMRNVFGLCLIHSQQIHDHSSVMVTHPTQQDPKHLLLSQYIAFKMKRSCKICARSLCSAPTNPLTAGLLWTFHAHNVGVTFRARAQNFRARAQHRTSAPIIHCYWVKDVEPQAPR